MASLADQAFSLESLREAWAEVEANDRADGVLSPGVARFGREADSRLARLNADLAWGAYDPEDLQEVVLDTSDRRVLHIPTVTDRVVARAVLAVAAPLVDGELGAASYGYRPGLGVLDAVQEVARLRDEGLGWVLRTDVDDCFPSVDAALAQRRLAALLGDPQIERVVGLLEARGYRSVRGGRRVMRGLAQGCPLSPLLANLVLVDIDRELQRDGFSPVRYADDVAVVTGSRDEAWEACRTADRAARRLGMRLGAEDTQVMSFEEGFTFLGGGLRPAVSAGAG